MVFYSYSTTNDCAPDIILWNAFVSKIFSHFVCAYTKQENMPMAILFAVAVCIGLASMKYIIHLNMFSFLKKKILQLQNMNIVHLFVTRFNVVT